MNYSVYTYNLDKSIRLHPGEVTGWFTSVMHHFNWSYKSITANIKNKKHDLKLNVIFHKNEKDFSLSPQALIRYRFTDHVDFISDNKPVKFSKLSKVKGYYKELKSDLLAKGIITKKSLCIIQRMKEVNAYMFLTEDINNNFLLTLAFKDLESYKN